jgi:hypothetical protein
MACGQSRRRKRRPRTQSEVGCPKGDTQALSRGDLIPVAMPLQLSTGAVTDYPSATAAAASSAFLTLAFQ